MMVSRRRIHALVGIIAALAFVGRASAVPINMVVTGDPVTNATGSYNVSVDPATGAISVVGINDGNTTDPAGPDEMKLAADFIGMTFKDGSGNTLNVTAASGSTNAGSDLSGNFTGGAWTFQTPPSSGYIGFAATTGARLGAFGGNTFTGSVTVTNPGDVASVQILVGGAHQSWRGVLVVPEPASLGLLGGAGLLALRRRSR